MDTHPDEAYVARCAFQEDLDRTFPRGAVCALLPITDGRVQAAGRVAATGRLFCSAARPTGPDGGWEYELLIDPRIRIDRPQDEIRIWIDHLTPHPSVAGLWEAPVRGSDEPSLLRLNANPPPGEAPGAGRRRAVSRAHEAELFPLGIET